MRRALPGCSPTGCSTGSKVLVVGTDALAGEITAVGLQPVRLFAEEPVAVVQGLSLTICWDDLAEAALAIRAGGAVGHREPGP